MVILTMAAYSFNTVPLKFHQHFILTEREKKIVNLRFFQGKTQTEVSTEIGISQAKVSRLEKSALRHMRKYM